MMVAQETNTHNKTHKMHANQIQGLSLSNDWMKMRMNGRERERVNMDFSINITRYGGSTAY